MQSMCSMFKFFFFFYFYLYFFRFHSHRKVDPTDLDFYTDLTNELRAEATKLGKIESLHVFEVNYY